MSNNKDRTVDEILTEAADFNQWTARIDELLRNVGLDLYTSSSARLPRGQIREPHRRFLKKVRRARALHIILGRVCHGIRVLIPEAARRDPFQVWAAIEARVKPFRFTGLPRELRDKIYHYLVPLEIMVTTPQCEYDRQTIPLILHVSQQIRTEFASIYYGESTFAINMMSESGQAVKILEKDQKSFDQWLAIAGPFQKHLRRFIISTINVDMQYIVQTFCFLRYREQAGFEICLPWVVTSSKEKELAAYACVVNERGNARGWKGERIIDGLMMQPEMWTLKPDDILEPRPECVRESIVLALLAGLAVPARRA